MTTTQDILTALQSLVAAEIPELQRIYTDLVPKDFKRPSALLQAVRTDCDDANKKLVDITEYLLITVFDITDDYTHTSAAGLSALQTKILLLFRKGYITVQDRALRIKASTGGRDQDRAYIDLQLNYCDNRDDTPDTTPLMESIESRFI